MTVEEKKLLVVDLLARMPYGVYVEHESSGFVGVAHNISVYPKYGGEDDTITDYVCTIDFFGDLGWLPIENFRPMLRPMSSMSDEEKMKYVTLTHYNTDENGNPFRELTLEALDWLNANHFDYRGLIEKGLATVNGLYEPLATEK
jgi:hypothetical protein